MFKVHKTETSSLMQLNFIRPMIVRKGENLFYLDDTKTTIFWYKMREEITLVQTIKFSFAITAFKRHLGPCSFNKVVTSKNTY